MNKKIIGPEGLNEQAGYWHLNLQTYKLSQNNRVVKNMFNIGYNENNLRAI